MFLIAKTLALCRALGDGLGKLESPNLGLFLLKEEREVASIKSAVSILVIAMY